MNMVCVSESSGYFLCSQERLGEVAVKSFISRKWQSTLLATSSEVSMGSTSIKGKK